jgi:hypothetical protein
LGSALVNVLRKDGHRVDVLTRRQQRPGDLQWSPYDDRTDDTTGWRRALETADAVINLAGEGIADRPWTDARKSAILDSRVNTTHTLVGVIKEARRAPPVFISASAVGFYGVHGDEPLTEDTPAGSDFLASVCVAWEAEALKAATTTRVLLLRSGLVLAKDGGALPQLALPFHFFAGGKVGSGRQYMSWIHRDDWVSIVRWALSNNRIAGPINLTAPEPVTNAEFSRTLGRVLHRPAILPAPAFALRIALGEMADAMILNGQRVLPQKLQSRGFEFRYGSLERALRAIYG